jgi:hypothetical protein
VHLVFHHTVRRPFGWWFLLVWGLQFSRPPPHRLRRFFLGVWVWRVAPLPPIARALRNLRVSVALMSSSCPHEPTTLPLLCRRHVHGGTPPVGEFWGQGSVFARRRRDRLACHRDGLVSPAIGEMRLADDTRSGGAQADAELIHICIGLRFSSTGSWMGTTANVARLGSSLSADCDCGLGVCMYSFDGDEFSPNSVGEGQSNRVQVARQECVCHPGIGDYLGGTERTKLYVA